MLPVVGEPGIDPETHATFVRGKQLMATRSAESAATARDVFLLCDETALQRELAYAKVADDESRRAYAAAGCGK